MIRFVFISIFFGCLFSTINLNGQSNVVTSGNVISGTGGNVSFSVGQIDYTTKNSAAGTATEGVQQPFEILVVTGVENAKINLQASVYPNPTVNQLTLFIDASESESYSYELIDESGRVLEQNKIYAVSTLIQTKELSQGIYFIKVVAQNGKRIKVFKIIKN